MREKELSQKQNPGQKRNLYLRRRNFRYKFKHEYKYEYEYEYEYQYQYEHEHEYEHEYEYEYEHEYDHWENVLCVIFSRKRYEFWFKYVTLI